MLDYGIHYEFIPFAPGQTMSWRTPDAETLGLDARSRSNARLRDGHLHQRRPCTATCLGRPGALYILVDPVPHPGERGGPQSYLNLAGEELMVGDADLRHCPYRHASSGVWHGDAGLDGLCPSRMRRWALGRHHWVIEPGRNAGGQPDAQLFAEASGPQSAQSQFRLRCQENRRSRARSPVVQWVSTGTFENLLKQKGKLGGQHKVPRLSMDPRWVEEVSEVQIANKAINAGASPL